MISGLAPSSVKTLLLLENLPVLPGVRLWGCVPLDPHHGHLPYCMGPARVILLREPGPGSSCEEGSEGGDGADEDCAEGSSSSRQEVSARWSLGPRPESSYRPPLAALGPKEPADPWVLGWVPVWLQFLLLTLTAHPSPVLGWERGLAPPSSPPRSVKCWGSCAVFPCLLCDAPPPSLVVEGLDWPACLRMPPCLLPSPPTSWMTWVPSSHPTCRGLCGICLCGLYGPMWPVCRRLLPGLLLLPKNRRADSCLA